MDTPILDITLVPTYSLKTMSIADISIYPSGLNINNATLEITSPGLRKVAISFIPKSVNTINSNTIQLTCVDSYSELASLPDGIYTLKYSIAPNQTYFIEKNFIRVDQLECKYANALLYLDLDESDFKEKHSIKLKKLKPVRILIDGSIAAMNECDGPLAIKLYQKANELVEDLLNGECNCN